MGSNMMLTGQVKTDPDDPDVAKVDSIKASLERDLALPDSIILGREPVKLPSGVDEESFMKLIPSNT